MRMSTQERSLPFGEHVFRLLVDTVEDYAMCALDPSGHIVYWNAGAVRTFGYSVEEALGQPLSMLFTPDDIAEGIPQKELTVAAQQGRSEDERWQQRKDGGRFWAMGIVVPVPDSNGTVLGFGKILRDRTDLKEVHEALRNRATELARSDENKNVFLATLAHELRNPLGVLMTSADLLRKSAAVSPARLADMIDRQVRHAKALVDDLLDIARVGQKKLQLRRTALDLRDTIRQAAEMTQALIRSRDHVLHLNQPQSPLVVAGDANRLLQIFVNLLNNAAKFTEPGGQISVTADLEDNEAVVRVVDNGVGIAPEQLPTIFDLFSQAHPTVAGSQLGVGIGLSLTRDLVALHEGTIQVRSAGLGKGSEFTVRVPLAHGERKLSDD
jgi:PAS domain S-box-containing protein